MKMKRGLAFLLLITTWAFGFAGDSLPKSKQTDLGLFINAQDAYERWKTNPEKVKVLDVRTVGEYVYVGHAPMAVNVPLVFLDEKYEKEGSKYKSNKNEKFVEIVDSHFSKTDTIYVMCRSGGRSARATNLLAKHGFKFVYTVIDGFEGDTVKDENSYLKGKRAVNGWKNSSAPWTYKLENDKVYKN
jgi:rhodanese-related sulfurtransferase